MTSITPECIPAQQQFFYYGNWDAKLDMQEHATFTLAHEKLLTARGNTFVVAHNGKVLVLIENADDRDAALAAAEAQLHAARIADEHLPGTGLFAAMSWCPQGGEWLRIAGMGVSLLYVHDITTVEREALGRLHENWWQTSGRHDPRRMLILPNRNDRLRKQYSGPRTGTHGLRTRA